MYARATRSGDTGGTASGTVACSIESPWSDGQIGQRQVIAFTIGSGSATEYWYLNTFNVAQSYFGVLPADLGVAKFYVEMEVVLSNCANVIGLAACLNGDRFSTTAGEITEGTSNSFLNSSGEMIPFPNGGTFYFRSPPMIIPVGNTTLNPLIQFSFNASGGVGSATMTAKINYFAVRRANVM